MFSRCVLAGATCWAEPETAQVRGAFFIARGVVLDPGSNDIKALVLDKARNKKTEPISLATHTAKSGDTIPIWRGSGAR